jgi:hypothetical protein
MEKVYHPCILQTKKRYVGFAYESPEQQVPVFDAKGIETVRCAVAVAVAVCLMQKGLRAGDVLLLLLLLPVFDAKGIDTVRCSFAVVSI